ncbi:MAG: HlyC/CorC family transporter [Alphaproteobacteria bacterium]|jgi:Mg2+/Co2+ transporter CorB|nr:HlyC/CorC family transporter [Alphaproteobacteria bacterium]|tara:strand:+ start:45 stop:1331 length:1287 start_codon:yes stop_codon:yes gene_type:complete
MTGEWYFAIGAIVLLLILSALFSGSETALTASSLPRIHELARRGNRRAKTVLALHEQRERLIGAILLGNNLVNILAAALATGILVSFFGEAGIAYATIAMTLLVLIFSEVLPKTYSLAHADRTALAVAPIVRIVVVVLAPVTHAIHVLIKASLKPFGIELSPELDRTESEEELRGAIDLHKGPEPEIRHERQMLRSILELDDVEVREVMTHRRNVEMIDTALLAETIVETVLQSPYTRLPLYREDPDNIVGVLHAKALLREVRSSATVGKIDIAAIAAEPWFIPETTNLLDQLLAFRERREHIATVVDEYGAFMGIVTLEDILEEIVGSIEDEHDVAVGGVRAQADGSYLVNGAVTIRDLNRDFEWDLPDDEAATIAGLILHETRTIPEPRQVFVFHRFRFEIMRRQRNQITLIRLTPPTRDAADRAN